jgi:NAD(P)-dependent dehydrogenase (short-subunit alcohol dehydrogenase family)
MRDFGFIVTGGTGALGRAVVHELLARGARVAVPYRSPAEWEDLKRSAAPAASLWGRPADLTDAAAVQRFVDESAAWAGRLDGVAAVAGGYAGSGPLEQAPVEEWTRMLATNLSTVYTVARAALPRLHERGGSLVTVSSRAVETGAAGAAAYVVSKAAVVALTRALALENRERGVRVNSVAPATIDTRANRAAMPQADTSRWTPPEAIARVIAFLLSPESAPLTGAVLPLDGPTATRE